MSEPLDAETVAFAGQMFDLARGGVTEQLAAYVDAGLPANLTNGQGDTLLILAAYHRHHDTVTALLERGADPSRSNDRGQTALAAAVFRRSPETVRALLAHGADPDESSPSARDMASFFELPEMAAMLPAPKPDAPSA